MQRDLVAGVFRNQHAVVHGVGRARRDEPHIHHSARSPGVALVDGIAVGIDLQRAIKVRAFFHRTFAIVLDHAAPENGLAFVVRALQFEPGVVGVDRAAGEKMSDLLGAHDDVHAHGIAAAERGLHQVQGSGDRSNFSAGSGSNFGFRLFAHGKRCGQFRLARHALSAAGSGACAGDTAKISTVRAPLFRNPSVSFSWAASSFAVGSAVFAPGKRCECTNPLMLPASFEGSAGMWQSAHCCGLGG